MSSDSSSSSAVGIVTSADDQYLYVWSKAVDPGAKELRFSKDSSADIKVGAWVHFDRTGLTGPDGVQTVSLRRAECMEPIAPIRQIKHPGGLCFWRASCVVTFCPRNYAAYVQAKAARPGLLGLAYNDVFGHIALLDGKLKYEVGKVYKVRIKRIDRAENDVAQAVGTLFCVSVGSMLDAVVEVREEDVRNRLLDKAPWLREGAVEEPARSKDTEVTCMCSKSPEQPVSSDGNNNGDLKGLEVVLDSKHCAGFDATPSADQRYEGIVYDVQTPYVRVYVPQFGIRVVALTASLPSNCWPAAGMLMKFRLKEAEGFMAGLHVPYQAVVVEKTGTATDEQLVEVHKIINAPKEQAGEARAGPTPKAEEDERRGLLYEGVVYEVESTVVLIYVSSLRKAAVAFKTDAFQPPEGTLLKFRLKASGRYFGLPIADAPEEIGVVDEERLLDVYKEVYPEEEMPVAQGLAPGPNRWEPTLSRSRLERAPSPIRWEPHDHLLQAVDNKQQAHAPKPTFAPPTNWNFTPTEKKVTDLLGVAVAAGRGTTTFYTRLGTVEIPVEAQIGVWVRMDVTLTDGRFAQGDDDVLRIGQLVPPPMDTRVIRGKRVMLTAEVEKHPDGVGNQYLGAVLDPLSMLPRGSPNRLFVVEMEFEKGCFQVIRYHKPWSFGAPATVPLKESAFPFPEDHRGLDVQEGIKEYAELLQLQHDI